MEHCRAVAQKTYKLREELLKKNAHFQTEKEDARSMAAPVLCGYFSEDVFIMHASLHANVHRIAYKN